MKIHRKKNSNISVLEEELEDISLTTQLSSKSLSLRTPLCRSLNKIRARRKECNLSFSREELIKIERDNLTLLKKIMAHAKPRTVSLNQPFSHKKTSAAINRAKQQKKIDQDNYILYSKISAMGRMKKVF
uniref:Cilia- and flagella-associated protein 97 n=1 Tax=Homalodisca liturata TaxID=320908 RepID=A0A1B6K0V3_9HEMI